MLSDDLALAILIASDFRAGKGITRGSLQARSLYGRGNGDVVTGFYVEAAA
jgi:hypothetical protein